MGAIICHHRVDLVHGLIGAGIGGLAGILMGEKSKKDTLLKAKQDKYSSQELKDALANGLSEDSAEFQQMLQKIKTEKLQAGFGKIKLTLKEIQGIAKRIVFDDQIKGVEKFQRAANEAEQNLSFLEDTVSSLDKLEWKASLGIELTKEEAKTYKSGIKKIGEEAIAYLESQHYKADMAVQLLLGVEESKGIRGLFKDILSYDYSPFAADCQWQWLASS